MKNNLKDKWLHRVFVVIYLLLVLVTLISATYFVINMKPSVSKFDSTYKIQCTDSNLILNKILNGRELTLFGNDDIENDFTKATARYFCHHQGVYDTFQSSDNEARKSFGEDLALLYQGYYEEGEDFYIPSEKNYEIIIYEEKMDSTWEEFIWIALATLAITFASLVFIRYIYFFIAVGKHKLLVNE